jgi:transcriptional regulator with XRE-family HTH domain
MKPGRKRAAWILYQLKMRGLTGAEIGRRAGVGKAHVSMVISGYRKGQRPGTKRVREEVAKALNKEVHKIFQEARP